MTTVNSGRCLEQCKWYQNQKCILTTPCHYESLAAPSALDVQVGGGHYTTMKIQPMEFSMANELDACQHTIVKYVCRFRNKNGIEDLRKARHVLEMLCQFEYGESL